MNDHSGCFPTPTRWGIGPGPTVLLSIGDGLRAAARWLALTPPLPRYAAERERMLTLQDVLSYAGVAPSPADVESALTAIEGMVAFARLQAAGHRASDRHLRLVEAA